MGAQMPRIRGDFIAIMGDEMRMRKMRNMGHGWATRPIISEQITDIAPDVLLGSFYV